MKYYIVYDGRAELGDTDDAAVFEALGNQFTKRDYQFWKDHDAVLAEYDVEGERDDELVNERVIGHWREGFKALKAKCSTSLRSAGQ